MITQHLLAGHTGPTVAEDDAKERGYLAQHPLFDQVKSSALAVVVKTLAASSIVCIDISGLCRTAL